MCELLHRRGLAGASVLLGVDGTAPRPAVARAVLRRNIDVPVMIIAVGEGERIAGCCPSLGALPPPLITLERVRVCKRDGELLETPHALPGTDAAVWRCGRS